jgi:NTE family protein
MADYRLGLVEFPNLLLANVVAASAAFPPVLSPLRLDLSSYEFVEDADEDGDEEVLPPEPVPPELRRRAVLSDGGIYDNHGLEPLKSWPTVFVADGGMPHSLLAKDFWTWYGQMRRVIDVTDGQVRALRRRGLIARFNNARDFADIDISKRDPVYKRNAAHGLYWGIGTNPEQYKTVGGLRCDPERVRALSRVNTRLSDCGEETRNALINWGYTICDKSVRAWHLPNAPPPSDWPRPGGLGN